MRAQGFQQAIGMVFTLLVIGLLIFAGAKGYGMLMHTAQKQADARFASMLSDFAKYTARGAELHTRLVLPDGAQGFCIFNLNVKDGEKKCTDTNGLGDRSICNNLQAYWQAAGLEDEPFVTLKGFRARVTGAYFGSVNAAWQQDPVLPDEVKTALQDVDRLDWYCLAGPAVRVSVYGLGSGFILLEEKNP